MKYLDGEYSVEVKDHRYKIHPTENIKIRKRDLSPTLRRQYQVRNETQIRINQKVVRNNKNQEEVKVYPKNEQPIVQQQKFKPPNCPSCKRKNWLEFDKGWFCQNCEYTINKQKHHIEKKVRRQDHYFSTRLLYANKKIREIWMNMVSTSYDSTKEMIKKLQEVKGKTRLKFYQNIINYYDEMNIRNFKVEENPFSKNARGVIKIYHEVSLLMKFLQTKPQVKNVNINFHELYYTVIKNRDDKEIVYDQNEDNEHDYINYEDFITPSHFIGKNELLQSRKLRS